MKTLETLLQNLLNIKQMDDVTKLTWCQRSFKSHDLVQQKGENTTSKHKFIEYHFMIKSLTYSLYGTFHSTCTSTDKGC